MSRWLGTHVADSVPEGEARGGDELQLGVIPHLRLSSRPHNGHPIQAAKLVLRPGLAARVVQDQLCVRAEESRVSSNRERRAARASLLILSRDVSDRGEAWYWWATLPWRSAAAWAEGAASVPTATNSIVKPLGEVTTKCAAGPWLACGGCTVHEAPPSESFHDRAGP